MEMNEIIHGEAIEEMKKLADKSVDLILCDLPYGTTDCEWDKCLPMKELWAEYKRIIKRNGAILLFAQQPFATDLINEGRKMFRYQIVWEKGRATGFLNAKRMPLRAHELILVFYNKLPVYNPQFLPGKPYKSNASNRRSTAIYRQHNKTANINSGYRYPRDVVFFNISKEDGQYHPTQKPLSLLRFLIKSYSNPGDLVLDNCCGSGSTCVAAKQTGRQYIGIELNEDYYNIAVKRCQG